MIGRYDDIKFAEYIQNTGYVTKLLPRAIDFIKENFTPSDIFSKEQIKNAYEDGKSGHDIIEDWLDYLWDFISEGYIDYDSLLEVIPDKNKYEILENWKKVLNEK